MVVATTTRGPPRLMVKPSERAHASDANGTVVVLAMITGAVDSIAGGVSGLLYARDSWFLCPSLSEPLISSPEL